MNQRLSRRVEAMSESKFSLIDLSALSEPACKLIDAVSQCIGTLYEPSRIRRKVKAEADAALILARADAERQVLLKRAAHRLALQEVRRQKNIESIINQAVKSLPESVSSEPVYPDWISRFFDECKDVSNEDLQKIWGRLLSGEVATPGACSRKTLAILKDLNNNDAYIFNRLCNLIWNEGDNFFIPYIGGIKLEEQLKKYNILYNDLLHFDSLGLIHYDLSIVLELVNGDLLGYFGLKHICNPIPKNSMLRIAVLPLTKPGIELFSIVNTSPNSLYYIDAINMLISHYNVFLSCPLADTII
jgi:uncharacterized repeat protein (TIGR03899 family)